MSGSAYNMPADSGHGSHVMDLYQDSFSSENQPPHIMTPEKRYLCPKYYIYNPVRARCLPTIMVSLYTIRISVNNKLRLQRTQPTRGGAVTSV